MFFRRFSAFRGIGKGSPEATQQELIAGHRQRRRVPIDTVCEVIWKPYGEHSRVDVFAHARKVHRDVYRCQPLSPNSHGGATLRHHLSLTLLALAAIAGLAMALGAPGDDAPMCVSELAIADVCVP